MEANAKWGNIRFLEMAEGRGEIVWRVGFNGGSAGGVQNQNISSSLPLVPVWSGRALEAVHHLDWASDGRHLLVTPAEDFLFELDPLEKRIVREFGGTVPGNGRGVYLPDGRVAVPGCDGRVRLYPAEGSGAPEIVEIGRGWIEGIVCSSDEKHWAVGLGTRVVVFDLTGAKVAEWRTAGAVQDLAWNPASPSELAGVGDGGMKIFKIGVEESTGGFEWPGASWRVLWSGDGRWIITGDQTPSVHLYDVPRKYPLHIQGYETKVGTLALDESSRWLATGGGERITVWDCEGAKGPEGSVPRQLEGHEEEGGRPVVLAYAPGTTILASGGSEGCLLLFDPVESPDALCRARGESPFTSLSWNSTGELLAAGTESGAIYVFRRSQGA